MSFEISYDSALNLVRLDVSGEITLSLSYQMVDAEVELLEKYEGASLLYNQAEATANDMSTESLMKISNYSVKLGELLSGSKMAVVLPDDLGFGLGRMWKSMTEVKLPFDVQLFRDLDAALDWLKES